MKKWLLNRYAAFISNTFPHRALYCMDGPPIEIHMEPSTKPIACHTPATIPLHWKKFTKICLEMKLLVFWKKFLTENPQNGAIEWLSPGNVTVCHVAQWTSPRLTSSVNLKHLRQWHHFSLLAEF